MTRASLLPDWQRAIVILSGTVVTFAVVAALYWLQAVFLPLAIAIFLAFLLSPLIRGLQRTGVARVPAVIAVVVAATLALAGLGWLVWTQVNGLVNELPNYTENMRAKIHNLRDLGPGSERLERMIQELNAELHPGKQPGEDAAAPDRPPAVVIKPESPSWLSRLPAVLNSVAVSAGGLLLALVFVFLILLQQEDLRNRFLSLAGRGRVAFTTKAIDDAADRISRYLLFQAVINGTFGVIVALGLTVIGVKYAVLWGFLAGVMRYIPYIGSWIGALFPLTLSIAMFEGWKEPLEVAALFVVLEPFIGMVLEPLLYGHGTGVSAVALLWSATFWAWLWGPVGLVLSAPLTVFLVVLGRYVPQLEFLDVILGDAPALPRDVWFYQRLLARDQDEATQIVMDDAKSAFPDQVFDELVIPTLNHAVRDREQDQLNDADEAFLMQACREIVEELIDRHPASAANAAKPAPAGPPVRILAYPARGEADRLALEMLAKVLDPAKWAVEVAPIDLLSGELLEAVAEKSPAVIVVGALVPGGLAHTRYLVKRLRTRFPDVKVLTGRWGLKENVEGNREQLQEAGADAVAATLQEAGTQLTGWLPVLEHGAEAEAKPEPAAGRPAARGTVTV